MNGGNIDIGYWKNHINNIAEKNNLQFDILWKIFEMFCHVQIDEISLSVIHEYAEKLSHNMSLQH